MGALQQLWAGSGLAQMSLGQGLMICIGLLLLYLAIVRKFEPLLFGNHWIWRHIKQHSWC